MDIMQARQRLDSQRHRQFYPEPLFEGFTALLALAGLVAGILVSCWR